MPQSRDLSPQWLLNNALPPDQALSSTGSLRKSSLREPWLTELSASPDRAAACFALSRQAQAQRYHHQLLARGTSPALLALGL